MGLPRRQRGRRYRRLDPADSDQAGQIAGLAVSLTFLLLEADFRGCPGLEVTSALNHAVLPIWKTEHCVYLMQTPIEVALTGTLQSRVNYNCK